MIPPKTLMIREPIKQRQAQTLLIETQQGIKIVAWARDAEFWQHRHAKAISPKPPLRQQWRAKPAHNMPNISDSPFL
jgi:hypothetical protein